MAENKTGCVMLYTEPYEFTEIEDILDIDETELTGDGLETEPHITVIYGIDIEDVDISHLLKELKLVIEESELIGKTFDTNEISIFTSPEHDVIKLDFIETAPIYKLRRLNTLLASMYDVESKFPNYIPHSTIAYVEKGEGAKYHRQLSRVYPLKVIKSVFSYKEDPDQEGHISLDIT